MEKSIPKERMLMVKHYEKNIPLRKIGEMLDVPHTKVHFWIKRYEQYGMNGLITRKQPGKKPLLSKKNLINIKEFLIENKPKRYKGKTVGWNSREVKIYIKNKYNIGYSLRHIERILHKLGFSLIVPRPRNIKSSKEQQNNFRRNFKKNLKKNMWVCR